MNERTMIGQEKEGDVIRHADQSSDPALRGGGGACPQEREALLGRFADLVYASALRQMNGDTHAAADVTQAVFIVAMEKRRAGKLPEDERLAGWLLKVTAFCVKKARWAAMQRRFHERRAMRSEVMQQELSTDAVAKALDGALLKLGAIDREVVVRRYLHGETVGSVAAAVRMTENAASQRIGRALEKLRKILARRGVVVPAVALTGVMIAESAKAAPAALAVAGAAAGANAAAMSIAKGAAMAMKMAAIKTVAVCVVVAVVIGAAVVFVAAQQPATPKVAVAATAPAVNEEAKVPGITQLARWSVVLNEAGAAEVKKACMPFASKSKVYEGMTANGAALRQAVKNAMSHGGAVRTSGDMAFAVEWPPEGKQPGKLFFHDSFWSDFNSSLAVSLRLRGHGDVRDAFGRVGTDCVGVMVHWPNLMIDLLEGHNDNLQSDLGIVFSREMGAGEATAFLGKYVGKSGKVYYHLVVWEVFKAQPEQMAVGIKRDDAGWWCGNGPEKLRQLADASRLWTAQATHERSQVAAGFEKKLEDGKVVRLVALCRPNKWPGCWWDAQGNPVAGANDKIVVEGDLPKGLWAMVEVEADGWKEGANWQNVPLQDRSDWRKAPFSFTIGRATECQKVGEASPVGVGVLVGPWKQVGSLYDGQSMTEGGTEYRVKGVAFIEDQFLVHFRRKGILANEDRVVPATVDGKTTEAHEVRSIVFGSRPADGNREDQPNFSGMAFNEVKEYRIYQRKREWVTFEGFAREPKVAPPTQASAEALEKAEALAKRRAEERKLAGLQTWRAGWRTVPADVKEPFGAIRVLMETIQKGDEKGVRGMLMSEKPRIAEQLGAVAHAWIVMEQVHVMAVARYGELAVQEKLGWNISDVEQLFMEEKWEGTADRVLTRGKTIIGILPQADGTYTLQLDKVANEETFAKHVQAITARMEKAKRLMEEHREMTVEELDAAMEKERAKGEGVTRGQGSTAW